MKYVQEIAGKSGIYIISNEIDSRIYVGSAKSFRHRCAVHKRVLKHGIHGNPKLMNFVNKHGLDKLIFKPVLACEEHELLKYEQEYLDRLQPFDENGFNILRTAGSPIGYKHTDEAKEKMKYRPRRVVSEEEKKMLSDLKKGIPRSEETKKKLSEIYNDRKKAVVAFDKNGFVGEFETVRSAAKLLNLDRGNILYTLKRNRKSTKGYFFIFKSYLDKIDIQKEIIRRFNNERYRSIIVKFLESGEVKEYERSAEFYRETGAKPASIVTAIKRGTPLYGKYIIEYKN